MAGLDDIVPTIDISDSAALDDQLPALDRACSDHGFFLLSGHGADDVIERTWEAARQFFQADRDVKLGVQRDGDNPLGWYDRELTKRRRDNKEVFDLTDPGFPLADAHNRWPTSPPQFRETIADFYDAFSELATRTVEVVHRALGLDPS